MAGQACTPATPPLHDCSSFPPRLQETSSVVSDYDCPCAEADAGVEHLLGRSPLADPRCFRDLEEAWKSPAEVTPDPGPPLDGLGRRYVVTQLSPRAAAGYILEPGERSDPAGGLDLTIDLNGLLESMDTITGSEEDVERSGVEAHAELDMDSIPILVRSMSTSRRHSWGVPLSPLSLGRRWVSHSPC